MGLRYFVMFIRRRCSSHLRMGAVIKVVKIAYCSKVLLMGEAYIISKSRAMQNFNTIQTYIITFYYLTGVFSCRLGLLFSFYRLL